MRRACISPMGKIESMRISFHLKKLNRMKPKIQKLLNGRFSFLIPLFIYTALMGVSSTTAFIPVSYVSKELWYVYLMIVFPPLIALIGSYFLAFLYSKNNKWIIGFVVLYAILFVWPFCMGSKSVLLGFGKIIASLPQSFMGIVLYISYDWYQKYKRQKELEKQNLQSELQLLKSQINPHFLFNTLNNIDSLIRSNPEKASNALIQISDMMRYMIYETNASTIPLRKELTYIENLLHLQQLQYANTHLADYSVAGNPESIQVAPMLFAPFIENAFKHCTDKTKEGAIHIAFEIKDKLVSCKICNISDKTQHINKESTSGIGLHIVKRRLELLYRNEYKLNIEEKNNLYCVALTLKTHD